MIVEAFFKGPRCPKWEEAGQLAREKDQEQGGEKRKEPRKVRKIKEPTT